MTKTALQNLEASFLRKYGARTVMNGAGQAFRSGVFSCGSMAVDYAVGGGFPTNRVVCLFGPPAAGKSTMALHAIDKRLKYEDQRAAEDPDYTPRDAVYVDQEGRLTPQWVARFVEEPWRVTILRPDTMEEATDMIREAITSEAVAIAVMDSIGGTPTQQVVDKSATKGEMGGNSQAVTRFSKFVSGMSAKYDVTIIGINQVRQDMSGYGRPMQPGGEAWKHACSLTIYLRPSGDKEDKRQGTVNGEKFQVGYKVMAKVLKNSMAPPFRQASYWFQNIESDEWPFAGVDTVDEVVTLGKLTGVIEHTGNTYSHPSFGKAVGLPKATEAIKASPAAQEAIRAEVLAVLAKGGVEGIAETFDEDEDEAPVPVKSYIELQEK